MDRHYSSGSRRLRDSSWGGGGSGSGWGGGGSGGRYKDSVSGLRGYGGRQMRRGFSRDPRLFSKGTPADSDRSFTSSREADSDRSFTSSREADSDRSFTSSRDHYRSGGHDDQKKRKHRLPAADEPYSKRKKTETESEPPSIQGQMQQGKPFPKGMNKRMFKANTFACPVCQFRSLYKEDMDLHLAGPFHNEHFQFLSTQLSKPKADFIQKNIKHKYKQAKKKNTRRNYSGFICKVHKDQDVIGKLDMKESISRVETVHCAACDLFIPMQHPLIQKHIKSEEHICNRKSWMEQSKKASLKTAQNMLEHDNIRSKLARYLKGEDPFTTSLDLEDSAMTDGSQGEPPEEGYEVGDEEGFEVGDEEEGFEVGDEEEGFEVRDETGSEDEEESSEVGKEACSEVGEDEGFEVGKDEEGFEVGDEEEGFEVGEDEEAGSEVGEDEEAGSEVREDEEAGSEVREDEEAGSEVGKEAGSEVGEDEEGFEVGEEEEGFEVGDEEEGF